MNKINENSICSYGFIDSFRKENPEKEICPINSDEVILCMEYIKRYLKPDKKGHSSYHFKHSVEKQYNHYIANGSFIVAALRSGCRVERLRLSSLNAYIYLDYKKQGA